jgi:hypothetical protein
MNGRSFFLSALLGGVIIAVLSNFPVLNFINCLLCIWVWVGAMLAVFIYRGFQHGVMDLTPGQGAGLGALSGVIGAFLGVFLYLLTSFITQPMFTQIARTLDINVGLPTDTSTLGAALITSFIFFIFNVVLYPLFGALGGLITASLMGQKPKANTGEIV